MKTKRFWKSRIKIALALATMSGLMLVLIVYLQPRIMVRWVAARSPDVLYWVPTPVPVVALTMDDGPDAMATPQILDLLKDHSARATFFLIGRHISGNEPLLERMRREGHELGNHLANDYPSILLPPDQFEREMIEVDQMLHWTGPIKWLRPGSGWYTPRMLRQMKAHGYRCALGSIYPHDPQVRSSWIISQYIIRRVFPGGIIILHDGPKVGLQSVEVLRKILPVLRRKGYQIVTLSELVKMKENDGSAKGTTTVHEQRDR